MAQMSTSNTVAGLRFRDPKLSVAHSGKTACLGLYANRETQGKRLFGEQTLMFAELANYAEEYGMTLAVLTPGYHRSGQGWRYDAGTGQWAQKSIALPDVVLRRSGTFRQVAPRIVTEDLNYFKAEGRLHTLPRMCSNKWIFYKKMSESKGLHRHLPHTHLARSSDEVVRFLQTYGDIYVKPLNGAQGVSIYRICLKSQTPVAVWERKTTSPKTGRPVMDVMEREFTTASAFEQFWMQTGLRQCLVQETIQVPRTPKGCPFDFRWLVQYTDDARVMARVARVGGVKSVTTNIHTGGHAVPAEQAAAYIRGGKPDDIIAALDKVALSIASRLKQLYGPFAEVGIDLAVRESGDVVVFEVNPTPGRRMLRSLPGNVRELSLRGLVEYASRATGISVGNKM